MKEIVLKKLKDNMSRYVSGQALSESLGVSRTAVWKYISELKKAGYEIESSSKKGYRLLLSPDTPTASEVGYHLGTSILGKKIFYFDEIDSTNSYAKKIATEGCDEGTVVIADRQTAGRGRLGRQWSSEPGLGIWMSVVLRPDILPEEVQIITLAASIAVVKAIGEVTGMAAGIKWPNDIILDGKKVCGILTEMGAEMERINYLVLGMGINVNHDPKDFSDDLADVATSLKIYAEKEPAGVKGLSPERKFNRSELARSILVQLEDVYSRVGDRRTREIISEWKKYSITLGRKVAVTIKNATYTGVAHDITADGRLVVNCTDGAVREVVSGEVSVRGLLGYA